MPESHKFRPCVVRGDDGRWRWHLHGSTGSPFGTDQLAAEALARKLQVPIKALETDWEDHRDEIQHELAQRHRKLMKKYILYFCYHRLGWHTRGAGYCFTAKLAVSNAQEDLAPGLLRKERRALTGRPGGCVRSKFRGVAWHRRHKAGWST